GNCAPNEVSVRPRPDWIGSALMGSEIGPELDPSSSVSESKLPSPLAVVAVARTVFAPALSGALTVWIIQLVQLPVPGNCRVVTVLPLIVIVAGRLVVVPLAYRNTRLLVPAAVGLTVHSTAAPTALSLLTKPRPVKPAWLLSTTPLTIVASSA